jgi:hypothetical protein
MKVIMKGKYKNIGDFKYSWCFSANVVSVLGWCLARWTK